MSLILFAPKHSNGPTPHVGLAIPGSTGALPSSVAGCGGPPWRLTLSPSSLPAQCAPRTSLLRPLPVLSCPWSHSSGLSHRSPPSEGNTVILTVIDRLLTSLLCLSIHLPGRPLIFWSTMSSACMASLLTSFRTEVPSSPQVWKAFCTALGATVSLSSGYHPQSNGQAERANQEMETALRCLSLANPSTWSSQLPWVEYAHYTLPNASLGMSLFLCSLGYQPPLFLAQEKEITVPSVQAHIHSCGRTWRCAHSALLHVTARSQTQAIRRCTPAPKYTPGQKVWLLSKDLPHSTTRNHGLKEPSGMPLTCALQPIT